MSLQETIIQQLGVKPVIDAQEEIRRSIDFLKKYLILFQWQLLIYQVYHQMILSMNIK